MATRTWNGSVDGDWNNANNWAEVAVPTTTDDVVMSGSAVNNCTTNSGAAASIKSLDFRAAPAGLIFSINITINQTVAAAFALRGANTTDVFTGTLFTTATGTYTFTTATASVKIEDQNLALRGFSTFSGLNININSSSTGTFTVATSAIQLQNVTITRGTFSTGGFAFTCAKLVDSGTLTKAVTLSTGSGSLTLTGTGTIFSLSASGTTLSITGSPPVAITDTSSTSKTFVGGGKAFGTLTITRGGSGIVALQGANVWSGGILVTGTGTLSVTFAASQTTNVGTTFFSQPGGVLTPFISVSSATPGTAFTLNPTAGMKTDGLVLKDCNNAGGGGDAGFSTNVSGNSGWYFRKPVTELPVTNIRSMGAVHRASSY